ncbi:hypothetical protein CYY_010239, partial [Polysphondylium violaceum]
MESITLNFPFTCTLMPQMIINKYGFRDPTLSKVPYEFYFEMENKEKILTTPLGVVFTNLNWIIDSNHHFVDLKTYVVYMYPLPTLSDPSDSSLRITFPSGKENTMSFVIPFFNETQQISYSTPAVPTPILSSQFAIDLNASSITNLYIEGRNETSFYLFSMNRPVYGNPQNATFKGVFPIGDNSHVFSLVSYVNGLPKTLGPYSLQLNLPTNLGVSIIISQRQERLQLPGFISFIYLATFQKRGYSRHSSSLSFYNSNMAFSFTPTSLYLQDGAYGIVSGRFNDYIFNSTLIISQYDNRALQTFGFFSETVQVPVGPSVIKETVIPVLQNISVIYLPVGFSRYFIVRASIKDNLSGFRMMYYRTNGANIPFLSSSDLIQGGYLDGTYEKVYNEPYFNGNILTIIDYASNLINTGVGLLNVDIKGNIKFSNPEGFAGDYLNIQSIRFTSANWTNNDIDVSSFANSTIFRFNVTDAVKSACPVLTLVNFDNFPTTKYYGQWNEAKQLYEIIVTIPLRTFTGVVDYSLLYGGVQTNSTFLNTMFNTSVLRVFSEDADMFGPEIIGLEQVPGPTADVLVSGVGIQIGWKFQVFDKLNGFESGNITIQSDGDLTQYTFTLDPNNQTQYIYIDIREKCLSQVFSILDIYLVDHGGYVSNTSNAFINYLDLNSQRIMVNCPPSEDMDAPVLRSLVVDKTVLDVGSMDRNVEFTLYVEDSGDGIKIEKAPYVYFTSINQIVKAKSNFISMNGSNVQFSGSIELPYGFGYPEQVLISIYGIVDNNGNFAGYSSLNLAEMGFSFFLNTTFNPTLHPLIESNADITSAGGKLMIMGKSFGLDNTSLVQVNYDDGLGYSQTSTPSFYSSTVLIIDNIKPVNKPFKVRVHKRNNLYMSNEYVVVPKNLPIFSDSSSSSSSVSSSSLSSSSLVSSSSDITPTQPPNPCVHNCGGSSQGYCSRAGCICYSPWMGIDCKSKVIIIPTPSINNTLPSTNISVPTDNGEQSTLTGLISIVELQELDTNNVAIYKYPFTQWIWSNISTDNEPVKYLYSTNITNQLYQSVT